MATESCLIDECPDALYAPAGTRSLCKEHFLQFLMWRKKKGGLGMFKKYSSMPMDARDTIVEEWTSTVFHTTAS